MSVDDREKEAPRDQQGVHEAERHHRDDDQGAQEQQLEDNTEQQHPRQSDEVDANAEMEAIEARIAEAQDELLLQHEGVRLTMQLIRKSASNPFEDLTRHGENRSQDQEVEQLLENKVLRLDWLDILQMENLDAFSQVEELYLQHNLISCIENLENLTRLYFLSLGGNRIRKIENLKHLTNLRFLDLSKNRIESLDLEEIPESLMIIRLAGNPFVKRQPEYAKLLFDRFPNIVQVDAVRREEEAASSPTSGSPNKAVMGFHLKPLQHDKQAQEQTTEQVYESNQSEARKNQRRELFEAQEHAMHLQLNNAFEDLQHKYSQLTLKARTRAKEITKEAISDSVAHFQQMEEKHREWQQNLQSQ